MKKSKIYLILSLISLALELTFGFLGERELFNIYFIATLILSSTSSILNYLENNNLKNK